MRLLNHHPSRMCVGRDTRSHYICKVVHGKPEKSPTDTYADEQRRLLERTLEKSSYTEVKESCLATVSAEEAEMSDPSW